MKAYRSGDYIKFVISIRQWARFPVTVRRRIMQTPLHKDLFFTATHIFWYTPASPRW